MLAEGKPIEPSSIWKWICLLAPSHCLFVYFDEEESSISGR